MAKKGKLIRINGPYQFDYERVLVDVTSEPEKSQVLYADFNVDEGVKFKIEAQVIPELIERLNGAYKEYMRRKSEWTPKKKK
jgi:hypothetical protein